MKLCECGCGEPVRLEGHKFIHNHHGKGKTVSLDVRQKISKAHMGKIHTEEHRKRNSEAHSGKNHRMYGKHHSGETKRKMSIARNKYWQNPDNIKRISERMKNFKHSDRTKQKISDIQKKVWQNSEYRKKMSELHKGVKLSDEHKKKISDALKGEKNHFYGKRHSKESRMKISVANSGKNNPRYGIPRSEATKKKISKSHMGKHHLNEEARARICKKQKKLQKKLWQNPEYKERMLKIMRDGMSVRPNNPEQRFIEICKKHNLSYKYVGDGEVWICGKNPDFINTNGKKEVIEVFGEVFHSPLFTFRESIPHHQTYQGTIDHYKKYGLKCHIFWDRDIMSENGERIVLDKLGVL